MSRTDQLVTDMRRKLVELLRDAEELERLTETRRLIEEAQDDDRD